jgi:hypothetical protein
MTAPRHEVADLVHRPGELSFEAKIGGGSQRVWMRSETPVIPGADPALAICLMPAMRSGGTLELPARVSPRLLRNQREYQAVQIAWSRYWELGQEPLHGVAVQAGSRTAPEGPRGRVAAFFSGGVDSWATLLANPDVTDLIFIRGHDLVPGAEHHRELAGEVEGRLRAAAAELGLPLHVVHTNAREFSDPRVRWEPYNPSLMAAVALFFEPLFERVLISDDTDHETQPPLGTARLVDHLWSTESLEIADSGGDLSREQRLRAIADHPVVRRTLRVCWENPGGAYNCGRCRKCMLTTIPLEALGKRELFPTFPPEFDLGRFESFEITQPIALVLWEDVLATTRACGRPDLEAPVRDLVIRGRRSLGLPPSYRSRRSHAEAEPVAPAAEDGAQAQLDALLGSRSWRLTAPLRRLGARRR